MTLTRRRAARLKAIAVLSLVLFALGAGGAAAYWTASDRVDGSAAAATVGITQTEPLKLATRYDAGNLVAAGTVTVKNTGAREAALAVTVGAKGSESLRSALAVRIAEVTDAAKCTPGANLKGLAEGTLGLTHERMLEAGASVTLCLQTTLPPRDAFRLAGKTTEVTVSSTLAYAEGADWTVSSAASVSQSVAAEPATGGPQLECQNRNPVLIFPYLELTGKFQPGDGEQRAFIAQGGTVRDIPARDITFFGWGKDGKATITDRALLALDGVTRGNAWIVIEQKTAGGEWKTVGASKITFESYWLSADVDCGWR